MITQFILFSLIVLAGTGGELCVSCAMKRVGEAKSFHPADIARVIFRAIQIPWMWCGVGLMATAFFALLGALYIYPVSFVVPVTALSYGAGALGGKFFLHEQVTRARWIGVCFVVAGVTLVFLGKQ